MAEGMIGLVRQTKPLIHCITNYVTVHDVANIILATGASPIMAESVCEVEEITSMCQGLVLNMGMLSENKLEAMILAGKRASLQNHPIVLDPVGVGASSFRTKAFMRLLNEVPCTVIRGNRSEICKAAELLEEEADRTMEPVSQNRGVDSAMSFSDNENLNPMLSVLSKKTGAIIVMTGKIDLVADGKQVFRIHNGHPMMADITGAGCMLNGVIAAFVTAFWLGKKEAMGWQECCVRAGKTAAWQEIGSRDEKEAEPRTPGEAVALAVAAEGICGELAYEKVCRLSEGTGSFCTYLIDFMSRLDNKQLMGGADIEIQSIMSDGLCSY